MVGNPDKPTPKEQPSSLFASVFSDISSSVGLTKGAFVKGRVEIFRPYGCRKIQPDIDNGPKNRMGRGVGHFGGKPLDCRFFFVIYSVPHSSSEDCKAKASFLTRVKA